MDAKQLIDLVVEGTDPKDALIYITEKYALNSCNVPLAKAREYAEREFEKAGQDLDEVLPNFDKGYLMMQKKCKKALNIPRIDMPVIEPTDMKKFDKDLASGSVDVFAPYAKGKLETPKNFKSGEGEEWIKLGFQDGKTTDDKVKGKWTSMAGKDLIPSQSQIWLEKLIGNVIKFGPPKSGSSVLNTTVIVSKEGYILDGHHRFGQVMIADPKLKLKALYLPVDIDTLLKVGRTYGTAIGNKQKA